jgi:ectoine hydroxylase-related dioxygenase (phytanoyl-CoA dioxygenase family)
MVALDEYTAANGATRIIPGSHNWGSERQGREEETVPALVPEGGVVYFISTVIHGGVSPLARLELHRALSVSVALGSEKTSRKAESAF